MLKIQDLTPINLKEEKEKFFKDFNYNPQFRYKKEISSDYLNKFGDINPKFVIKAKEIIQKNKDTNNILDNIKIPKIIALFFTKRYLKKNNLNQTKIILSKKFISRTANNAKTHELKIRLPINYAWNEFKNVLDHELGTHALRAHNEELQSWFNHKKQFNLSPHQPTEEGLAVIHQLLHNKNKLAFLSASRYLAIDYASSHSFNQTFAFFNKFIKDDKKSWGYTIKIKRGLLDTSKPGFFSKEKLYFEGFIKVINYLKQNNYNPTNLYLGRIDLDDLPKILKLNPNFSIQLPHFYTSNPKKYTDQIKQIIKINNL